MRKALARYKVTAFCAALALLGFAVPLWNWSLTAGFDWDLFDSYSLVARSLLLVYHRLPLHDPWICGGLDLVANPQMRMFSPVFLLDLALNPHSANLVSLVLYGFFGALGMYMFLRARKLSIEVSLTGAAIFINSSWFGLHFVEGHIAYGSMQLFPWILYCASRLEKPAARFGLLSVMALFVVDGGIYAAIYAVMILLTGAAVGLFHPSTLFRGTKQQRILLILSALSAILIVSVKVVPVLLLSTGFMSNPEFTEIKASELGRILFDPFQRSRDIAGTASAWRFHEFGCYLSPLAAAVILFESRSAAFLKRNSHYLVLIVLFFWIASGWGGDFNIWNLYARIPLLNKAHVQSRLFIVMHLFFTVLAAEALEQLKMKRKQKLLLLSVLLLEALFVKNYPFYAGYEAAKPRPAVTLIPKASIQGVHEWGDKPELYYSGSDTYVHAYETAAPPTSAVSERDPAFKGPVYVLEGEGTVGVDSFTPGHIDVRYSARGPLKAELNSNFLGGWVVTGSEAKAHSDPNGLIGLDLPAGQGVASLLYRPSYLFYVLPAFGFGLLLWLGLVVWFARRLRTSDK